MKELLKPSAYTLIFTLSTLASTASLAAQSWEYQAKTYRLVGDKVLTQKLNSMGAKGWELVNCTVEDSSLTCLFKKPLDQK